MQTSFSTKIYASKFESPLLHLCVSNLTHLTSSLVFIIISKMVQICCYLDSPASPTSHPPLLSIIIPKIAYPHHHTKNCTNLLLATNYVITFIFPISH